MKLLIIGTGYVGLVAGTCFAEMGHQVTCLDIDNRKISSLKEGTIPIYEPGLNEMVQRNRAASRLHFCSSYDEAVEEVDVCFLTVDTPVAENGSADLTALKGACTSLARVMKSPMLIVNKSTVPVGTARYLQTFIKDKLLEKGVDLEVNVVANPEFLKEGDAVQDFMKPDRIIIGSRCTTAIELLRKVYAPFMVNRDRLLIMDSPSAEMTKLAANAMLATRISFMNGLSDFCEKMGIHINEVRKGIGSDSRIGHEFLYAGPGYGGSCFPKDIRNLATHGRAIDCPMPILEAVEEVNKKQKLKLGQKIVSYFSNQGGLEGKTVGVLGLAFKPNTDDMREAPSLPLIQELLAHGAMVQLFDPEAMKNAENLIPDTPQISWCRDEKEAAQGADALVLVTEWKQFRFLNFDLLGKIMKQRLFFDGRNQYSPAFMVEKGFSYFPIGAPAYLAHTHANEVL